MNLKEFKTALTQIEKIEIEILNKKNIPKHFHITEVGITTKKFIDCGGVLREKNVINFQLWTALDFDHRLDPKKLLKIIEIAEQKIGFSETLEIEVEYQQETISLFDLTFNGEKFVLIPQNTNCLAKDKCGITESELPEKNCCGGNGCC